MKSNGDGGGGFTWIPPIKFRRSLGITADAIVTRHGGMGKGTAVGLPEPTRHGLLLAGGFVGKAASALCRDSGQGQEFEDRLRPIPRHYVTTPCAIPGLSLGTRRCEAPGTAHRLYLTTPVWWPGASGRSGARTQSWRGLLRAPRLHNTVSHTRSAWAPPSLLVTP